MDIGDPNVPISEHEGHSIITRGIHKVKRNYWAFATHISYDFQQTHERDCFGKFATKSPS